MEFEALRSITDSEWPQRAADLTARPILVHLDQWCWDHLARDRAGRPTHASEVGTYGLLRQLALDGRVAFPLSASSYRENWPRSNDDATWDTAVVMAELSGFNTLTSTGVAEWDADFAVCAHFGWAMPPKPAVLGWGVQHCFPTLEVEALVNRSTELVLQAMEAAATSADSGYAESIRNEMRLGMELAMLARQVPTLPGDLEPIFLPPILDALGARFEDDQRSLRSNLGPKPTKRQIRDAIEVLSLRDSDPFLGSASLRHGLGAADLLTAVADAVHAGDRSAVSRVLRSMPVQGAFTELRVQAHLQEGFGWSGSDCVDFLALASIAPFVDAIVVDKRTFNLSVSAGIVTADQTLGIHRQLSSLCSALRQRVDLP